HQIEEVIARFTHASVLSWKAGFHGVEIHAGRTFTPVTLPGFNANIGTDGFLLSQFLSSSSNHRNDEFGGSAERRVEILLRILRAIRAEVPPSFCVGVKINTADHMNASGF